MSTHYTKSEYANMKLIPGLLCLGGAIGSYMVYDSYAEYKIYINDTNVGKMSTNMGGKLVLSVEIGEDSVPVKVVKL